MWDDYVRASSDATLYHLYGWRSVIEKTYGHKTYYLAASRDAESSLKPPGSAIRIVGILPLVHLKQFIFGNALISMPFFDMGGVLADDEETERALILRAVSLGEELRANTIELRQARALRCLHAMSGRCPGNTSKLTGSVHVETLTHKVRMLLTLPDSPEKLMQSFKSKLRSQIRKPMKEGLTIRIGGNDLLGDFYRVFSVNMRDLGSPVHSINLMRHILTEFPDDARIIMVYKDKQPMAGGVVIAYQDTLENPWASSLRRFASLSPNMLLYWSMLEYACNRGLRRFDFGRSTPGEGTYRFKEQWGAAPNPLHWHYLHLTARHIVQNRGDRPRFESLIKYWQKLPVSVSRLVGPMIRKHIGL